jgi:outer membrane receptor protein involved in Fe transport
MGMAVGGALVEKSLLGRASIYSHRSDGYMENDFLGKDNTQNQDEVTARGHLKWLVSNDLTVDLNLLHLSIDNGYDAFTLDNSRHSLSDQPGEDSQNTNAVALKTDWRASDAVQIQSSLSYVNSDVVYSYDADWTYDGIHPWGYVGFEEFKRARENYAIELKALSNESGRLFNNTTDWAFGINYLAQDEDLNLNSPWTPLVNEYETKNTALFGQLDTHITDKLTLISGLRIEYFEADYQDSNNLDINTDEYLYGGKLGLNYQLNENHMAYTSLSRGYKSGGVNNNDALPDNKRKFDTEYMYSLEAGLKSLWLEGDMMTNLAVFHSWRRDAQVKSSVYVGGGQFEDSITNAARGRNLGIEADMDWLVNDKFRLMAAVGILKAVFDEYDNPDLTATNVDGRRQAHAPNYQFTLGGEYYVAPGWTFRTNLEGKDEFYFSNSHNSKSKSYVLTNASLDYQQKNWKVSLWGRNLFDRDYYTRGFYFGNDPRDGYIDHTYVQYGDPRVVGLNFTYDY